MTSPLLLIDGDVFLYNSCLSAEYESRWDEDTHYWGSDFNEALQGFRNQLNFVGTKFQTDKFRIAFTKGETFRHVIYPSYKQNRKDKRKPLCFARVREAIEADYQTLAIPGLEADDILGIWATRDKHLDPIIVSADKDMQTIPGKLWRKHELIEVTQAEADYFWMTQTLTGDVTDGYPGCPGIGAAKARKLLDTPEGDLDSWWEQVVKAYEDAGLTQDDAITQARLARILRVEDWDSEKKQPILWSPNA